MVALFSHNVWPTALPSDLGLLSRRPMRRGLLGMPGLPTSLARDCRSVPSAAVPEQLEVDVAAQLDPAQPAAQVDV